MRHRDRVPQLAVEPYRFITRITRVRVLHINKKKKNGIKIKSAKSPYKTMVYIFLITLFTVSAARRPNAENTKRELLSR